MLIEEYHDEFEFLVVEVSTKEKCTRVISGYGPQENWEEEKRLPFLIALETEIERAELADPTCLLSQYLKILYCTKYIQHAHTNKLTMQI